MKNSCKFDTSNNQKNIYKMKDLIIIAETTNKAIEITSKMMVAGYFNFSVSNCNINGVIIKIQVEDNEKTLFEIIEEVNIGFTFL